MKRALVVDDSRVIRRMLSRILAKQGYCVEEATNGRDGLQLIKDRREIGLICTDWNMPDMDGLEFLANVRADSHVGIVPVLMITAETKIECMVQAMEAGASEYLMKPFDEEMVVDKLKMVDALR